MFFNPAQMQSQMNSPQMAMLLQQMQGSGMGQLPGGNGAPPSNAAPQIPTPPTAQGGGTGMQGMMGQVPQQQPGFFQQMLGSPQGMNQGVQGLTGLGGMLGQGASGLGSLIGKTGNVPTGFVGPLDANQSYGSGLLGMMGGGSSGSSSIDSLMALLGSL